MAVASGSVGAVEDDSKWDSEEPGEAKRGLRQATRACIRGFRIEMTYRIGSSCAEGDSGCQENSFEELSFLETRIHEAEAQCFGDGYGGVASFGSVGDGFGTPDTMCTSPDIITNRNMFNANSRCSSDAELQTQTCDPETLNRAGKVIDCWLHPSNSGEVKFHDTAGIGSDRIAILAFWVCCTPCLIICVINVIKLCITASW